MRNLLAFVGAVILVVGGLGLYLGWFKIQKEPDAGPGTSRYQFEVDQNKIHQDVQRVIPAGQPATTAPTTAAAKPATTAPAHGWRPANGFRP